MVQIIYIYEKTRIYNNKEEGLWLNMRSCPQAPTMYYGLNNLQVIDRFSS